MNVHCQRVTSQLFAQKRIVYDNTRVSYSSFSVSMFGHICQFDVVYIALQN